MMFRGDGFHGGSGALIGVTAKRKGGSPGKALAFSLVASGAIVDARHSSLVPELPKRRWRVLKR